MGANRAAGGELDVASGGWKQLSVVGRIRCPLRRSSSGKAAVTRRRARRLLLASCSLPNGVAASGPKCVGDKADFRRAAVSGPLLAESWAGTGECKSARLPMQSRPDRSGTTAPPTDPQLAPW
jgi:hypothetical protein